MVTMTRQTVSVGSTLSQGGLRYRFALHDEHIALMPPLG